MVTAAELDSKSAANHPAWITLFLAALLTASEISGGEKTDVAGKVCPKVQSERHRLRIHRPWKARPSKTADLDRDNLLINWHNDLRGWLHRAQCFPKRKRLRFLPVDYEEVSYIAADPLDVTPEFGPIGVSGE